LFEPEGLKRVLRTACVQLRKTIMAATAGFSCAVVSADYAAAQGLFDALRQNSLSYAPNNDTRPVDQPLNIVPSFARPGTPSPQRGGAQPPKQAAPAATLPSNASRQVPKVSAEEETEDDEDENVLIIHEKPKLVRIVLPPPRPGGTIRTAAEVAPVGQQRWRGTELPPGVNLPGATQSPAPPPRLASLPSTQSTPRWTMTDEPLARPQGLRETEYAVANMPGVYADEDATFQCLPVGLKQVLVDTAKRFGHVAILNARRPQGTGARRSYHYQCRAVDFRVRGVAISTVYAFLKQHPNVGGRKIYPMGFFHIDDGPVRSW
jgi:Bacterial protein of unknown function (DUF882)